MFRHVTFGKEPAAKAGGGQRAIVVFVFCSPLCLTLCLLSRLSIARADVSASAPSRTRGGHKFGFKNQKNRYG